MTRLEIAARMLAAENPIEERDVAADGANHARMALAWADALLAAAEKPAACAGCNGHGEVSALMQDGSRRTDACPFCAGSGRAEKPTEAAPVAPLPWVVRRRDDKTVVATFLNVVYAGDYHRVILGDSDTFEVAAAPTVAAVKFTDDGDAEGSDWHACRGGDEAHPFVAIEVDLRPGEDAGETVAKMLAACGRGP